MRPLLRLSVKSFTEQEDCSFSENRIDWSKRSREPCEMNSTLSAKKMNTLEISSPSIARSSIDAHRCISSGEERK